MLYKYFNSNWILLLIFIFNFLLSSFLIKSLIFFLKSHSKFQPIRNDGPKTHIMKARTPTMGGLAFNFSAFISMILFCDLDFYYTKIGLFLFASFSIIGLIDDIIKVFCNSTFGFRGSIKLVLEIIIGSLTILLLAYFDQNYMTESVKIPLFNNWLNLGIFGFPFFVIALVGSANATNITDGLDGLLCVPVVIISLFLFLYVIYSKNFNIELTKNLINFILISLMIVCSSFLSFFIYNKHPAKIFMGDVGSLSIGAFLFYIAYLLKIEMFYAIMGMLFIIELASSTIQVSAHIFFNKSIFKMAPLHHHFEKCGISETHVVKSFWLFSFITSLIGFTLILL